MFAQEFRRSYSRRTAALPGQIDPAQSNKLLLFRMNVIYNPIRWSAMYREVGRD
jgi:hypothetical protein